jgi:hypothetical protein
MEDQGAEQTWTPDETMDGLFKNRRGIRIADTELLVASKLI